MSTSSLLLSTPNTAGNPVTFVGGSTPWFTIWQDAKVADVAMPDPFTPHAQDVKLSLSGSSSVMELRVRYFGAISTADMALFAFGFVPAFLDPSASKINSDTAAGDLFSLDASVGGSWSSLFLQTAPTTTGLTIAKGPIFSDTAGSGAKYTASISVDTSGCSSFIVRPFAALTNITSGVVEARLIS